MGRGTLECQWVVAKVLKVFLEEAMQCDVTNLNTPRYYIKCLLDNEDLEEAEKLINYSLKIKGIDKATMWFYRSLLSEKRGSFLNALKFLSESEKYCFSSQSLDVVKDRKKFIKSKMPKKKSKNRKETK
ncbi:hypothetical protein CHRY9390_01684 [Chryseobacterium aquaeductus]|uniref:Uncharacterized protein n=1 Tax=Chryseobacterium aquaeductus TaxID=2675056 RepID=A0A9N8QSH0_9FLAO|nr:hypothetical protein CHRY9390_01684 [Chryseobacterium potabilaquae]CAD7807600.1 hypothetical protein CHRY9390_01684 [Chryseobacterium aquaeductus]